MFEAQAATTHHKVPCIYTQKNNKNQQQCINNETIRVSVDLCGSFTQQTI